MEIPLCLVDPLETRREVFSNSISKLTPSRHYPGRKDCSALNYRPTDGTLPHSRQMLRRSCCMTLQPGNGTKSAAASLNSTLGRETAGAFTCSMLAEVRRLSVLTLLAGSLNRLSA